MEESIRRKLLPFLDIRPGEWPLVGLLTSYFCLVITSHYVIKPVRNSLFIERLGADNLPYVYIATAIFAGIIVSLYSRIGDRVSRTALVLGTLAFLASNLLVFWWFLRTEAILASGAFYIWAKLYPLLLVSQFWLVASQLFTTPQAKRVFGIIGAGGIVGGIAGSAIAGFLATRIGSEPLLLVSAGILGLSALLILAIDRFAPPVKTRPQLRREEEESPGVWTLLKESSHLRTIAYLLGLTIVVSTIVDWQFNKAVELFVPGEDMKTEFLARFFVLLNFVSIGIQLFITSWILRVFGVGIALLLLPAALLAGSLGIVLFPTLWAAAIAKGTEGSMRYSLDQSTRELLFLPLPGELKYRGKPLVDMAVYRLGTGIGGLIVLLGTAVLSFGLREMAILSAALLIVWMAASNGMRREFRQSVKRLIRSRDVESEELIVKQLDAGTRADLIQALDSKDHTAVLYALALLSGIENQEIVQRAPQLLSSPSERVRARTLQILLDAREGGFLPEVEPLLEDPSLEVRLEAVHFVCALGPLPEIDTMANFINSKDPEVRAAALACIAQRGNTAQATMAEALLSSMAKAQDGPLAVRERQLAAEAIGMIETPARAQEALAPLLFDEDIDVVRAAMQAATKIRNPELVPPLVSGLCCRDRGPAARAALASYGSSIFEVLADTLRNPNVPTEVRTAIPSVFYESAGQRAVDTLVHALPDLEPEVRRYALKTLNRMRRNHDGLSFPSKALEGALHHEALEAYQLALDRVRMSGDTLLERVLGEHQDRAVERMSRVLGLIYPLSDIFAAYQGISSNKPEVRAAGFELLDTTLSPQHRRLVSPITDPDLPNEERARRGVALLPKLVAESCEAVIERRALQTSELWLAVVASAAGGRPPPNLPAQEPEPYHAHLLPNVGLSFRALLTQDGRTMLRLVERADFLRHVEIFSEVTTEDLAKIAAITRERDYPAGDLLFSEGAEGSELFLVVSGQVRATRQEKTLFIADPGETVGTLALIDTEPREFTATVTKDTRVLCITRDDFFDLLRDHFDLVEGLLAHLTWVVRKLNDPADARRLGRRTKPLATT